MLPSMNRHADNTFSTGTSKVDNYKVLRMPPDSISEGVIFQNFPWGHAPRLPSVVLCTL